MKISFGAMLVDNCFSIFFRIVSLAFVEFFKIVFGDFIVKVFIFMDFIGMILMVGSLFVDI